MRTSDFMLGFIFGGILGAAAALLYTPASGRSLRTQTQGYFQNLRQEMQAAKENKRIELEQELNDLRTSKPDIEE